MTSFLVAWVWLSLGLVTVDGAGVCPTADEVAGRVAKLMPNADPAMAPDLAHLDERDGALSVSLRRPDGTVVGERAFARTFSCADLAAAVAVVVATWESDVHAEFQPTPPVVQSRTNDASSATMAVAHAEAPSRGSAFDVGAALAGSLAPGAGSAGPTIGALVVASYTPVGHAFGARLALVGTNERDLALQAGTVRWRRIAVAIGPQLRLATTGRWAFDLHGDALAAWVLASGEGFAEDRSTSGADLALGAGARLLRLGGRLVPWLELSADGWLRPQTAYTTPSGSATLPRLEGLVALGLSFCACPEANQH
jgi:hypothetical protein